MATSLLAGIVMTYIIYYIYHRLNIKLNANNLHELDNYVLNTINALDYSFSYAIRLDSKFMGLLVFLFANVSCGLFNYGMSYAIQNIANPWLLELRFYQILFVSLHLFISTIIPSIFNYYYYIKKINLNEFYC